jgi:hypothetical protein
LPENRLIELSELLFSLTTEQIKDCIGDQDNQYLITLRNKSLALEHYGVCAAIADILHKRISQNSGVKQAMNF